MTSTSTTLAPKVAAAAEAERLHSVGVRAVQAVANAGTFDSGHVPDAVLRAWQDVRDVTESAERAATDAADRAQSWQDVARAMWQDRARFLGAVHAAMGYPSVQVQYDALKIGTDPRDPDSESVRLSVIAGLSMLAAPERTVDTRQARLIGLSAARAAHKAAVSAQASIPDRVEQAKRTALAKAQAAIEAAEAKAEKTPDAVDLPKVRAEAEARAKREADAAAAKAKREAEREAAKVLTAAKVKGQAAAKAREAKKDQTPVTVAHLTPLATGLARIVARVERNGWESQDVRRAYAAILKDAAAALKEAEASHREREAGAA
jgi:hypothetical protein